jgi:hypothetical protein
MGKTETKSDSEKVYKINMIFSIKLLDKKTCVCYYKREHIKYENLKVTDSLTHTVYESLKDIRYNISKSWFVRKHVHNKNNVRIEICFDIVNYLICKDYFQMNDLDKILISILYTELNKLKDGK